jgi:hypothetical protein
LAALLFTGCGGAGGDAGSGGGNGNVVVDSSRTVSGAAHADLPLVLNATDASGATYTLTVPEGAVTDDVQIKMTPVKAVKTMPGQIVGGVQLEPEGMVFSKPLILKVTPPTGQTLEGTAAFGAEEDASEPYLMPSDVSSGTILVPHFSAFGYLRFTPVDLQKWPTLHSAARTAMMQLALPQTAERKIQIYTDWWDLHVEPALTAGGAGLISALKAYMEWSNMLYPPAQEETAVVSGLASVIAESETVLAGALKDGIDFQNDACKALEDTKRAKQVVFYWSLADLRNVDTVANHLDRETVKRELCVQPEFTATFPDTLPTNGQAPLNMSEGGYKIGDHELLPAPLDVKVTATGATESQVNGTLPVNGNYSHNFTPSSGSKSIALDVQGCYRLLPSFSVCKSVGKTAGSGGGGDNPVLPTGTWTGAGSYKTAKQPMRLEITSTTITFTTGDYVGAEVRWWPPHPTLTITSVQKAADGTITGVGSAQGVAPGACNNEGNASIMVEYKNGVIRFWYYFGSNTDVGCMASGFQP